MNTPTHDAYLAIIDAAEARLAALTAAARALEIRVVELTLVGDTLHHLARHADTCGLQHGSHCTCAMAAWERLTERRA